MPVVTTEHSSSIQRWSISGPAFLRLARESRCQRRNRRQKEIREFCSVLCKGGPQYSRVEMLKLCEIPKVAEIEDKPMPTKVDNDDAAITNQRALTISLLHHIPVGTRVHPFEAQNHENIGSSLEFGWNDLEWEQFVTNVESDRVCSRGQIPSNAKSENEGCASQAENDEAGELEANLISGEEVGLKPNTTEVIVVTYKDQDEIGALTKQVELLQAKLDEELKAVTHKDQGELGVLKKRVEFLQAELDEQTSELKEQIDSLQGKLEDSMPLSQFQAGVQKLIFKTREEAKEEYDANYGHHMQRMIEGKVKAEKELQVLMQMIAQGKFAGSARGNNSMSSKSRP